MGGPHVPVSSWRHRVARVRPEIVALVLSILVVIGAWLILRPGAPVRNGAPGPSTEPGASAASIVIGSPTTDLAWFVVTWPARA
jgi:hypothetical protein